MPRVSDHCQVAERSCETPCAERARRSSLGLRRCDITSSTGNKKYVAVQPLAYGRDGCCNAGMTSETATLPFCNLTKTHRAKLLGHETQVLELVRHTTCVR